MVRFKDYVVRIKVEFDKKKRTSTICVTATAPGVKTLTYTAGPLAGFYSEAAARSLWHVYLQTDRYFEGDELIIARQLPTPIFGGS